MAPDRCCPELETLAEITRRYCQWAGIQTLCPLETPQVPSTQMELCEGGSPRSGVGDDCPTYSASEFRFGGGACGPRSIISNSAYPIGSGGRQRPSGFRHPPRMPAAVIPQRIATSFLMIEWPGCSSCCRQLSLKTRAFANDHANHFCGRRFVELARGESRW